MTPFNLFIAQLLKELPSVSHKVIIDQINTVASKIRQWNYKVDKHDKDLSKITLEIAILASEANENLNNEMGKQKS
jgi:hypothetical protein